jgi:hypothetical protein
MAVLRAPSAVSVPSPASAAGRAQLLWCLEIPAPSPAGSLPLAADCFISRLHLHDFVDGELDTDVPGSALREIILEHLVHCTRCARLEQQVRGLRVRLRAVGQRLDDHPDERPSAEFRARMSRLLAG